jgi:hypothetical protein
MSVPFTLRDVPGTMRKSAMPIGAALMDRWFAGDAWEMSPREKDGTVSIGLIGADRIEDGIVTMAWALGFPRVAAIHERLLMTWSQPQRLAKSQQRLTALMRAWLHRHPSVGDKPFRFGDLRRPVREIEETCQINLEVIEGSLFDELDDFFAAIERASFKIAISGMAEPGAEGTYTIAIDRIGTYLRDTYDFNGDQRLGSWSRNGVSRVAMLAPAIPIDPVRADNETAAARGQYYTVDNGSFRAYRARFGKGRDFFVHSDVLHRSLPRPIIVAVRP